MAMVADERYWGHVDPSGPTDCWLWTGPLYVTGYGQWNVNNKSLYAHRAAWEIHNKREIPPKMMVRHSCDNPRCVNPAHLSIGNQKDNMHDMVSRGRQSKGESRPLSKITEADALAIISMRGRVSQSVLARRYGMAQPSISDIQTGRRWGYLHSSHTERG